MAVKLQPSQEVIFDACAQCTSAVLVASAAIAMVTATASFGSVTPMLSRPIVFGQRETDERCGVQDRLGKRFPGRAGLLT